MAIVVNGSIWKIRYVEPNDSELRRSDGSYTVGTTDNESKTVYLSNNLKGKFLKKVICHEICHVYCFEYDMMLSVDFEEILANFIAEFGANILDTAYFVFENLKKAA